MSLPYEAYFKGKRVTLMGLGLLGRGIGDARFLAECGADLIVTDLKSEEQLAPALEELKNFNITCHLGGHRLEDFKDRDLVIKAAGVPLDSSFIAEAHKNNIPVRMSADLFVELSGVASVGVTGTRGKSTVTHLMAHVLKAAGMKVLVGGNVKGVSTLELLKDTSPDAIAVLELDSWQLQGFGEAKVSPNVAIFTTFMPDHMNYYGGSMEKYFADKAHIFLNQKEDDFFIMGEQVAPKLKEFGYENKIKAHTTIAGSKDIPKDWQLRVPGEHNRYNAGIAAAAARALGADDEVIKNAIETFEGVPGRLQLIKEVRGIKIYNDTTATVPEATVAALLALDPENKKNIILIAGGADKGLDMSELLKVIPQHCKKVLLLDGSGTERIKKDLPEAAVFSIFGAAVEDAFHSAAEGDIILLSSAFASFGMFKNEYDRGDQFNALVEKLS